MIEGLIERDIAFISKTSVVHSEQVFTLPMTELFSFSAMRQRVHKQARDGSAPVDWQDGRRNGGMDQSVRGRANGGDLSD